MTNQRNQNDNNEDTRRHLGFKLQDKVVISNKFFNDHNITPCYLGQGVVIAKIMPSPQNLPALIIEMPSHPVLLTELEFRKLIIPMQQNTKGTVVIKIHPLYIELIKEVKSGKKVKR